MYWEEDSVDYLTDGRRVLFFGGANGCWGLRDVCGREKR